MFAIVGGCYEDDIDYEEPPQEIVIDATGEDADLSQPLIVNSAEPSAPADGGTSGEANAVAV